MNKEELIDKISARTKLTKADSRKALEATIIAISGSLSRQFSVDLPGFGRFEVHSHKARSWRNRSGKLITLPAHKTVFFVCSDALKETVA